MLIAFTMRYWVDHSVLQGIANPPTQVEQVDYKDAVQAIPCPMGPVPLFPTGMYQSPPRVEFIPECEYEYDCPIYFPILQRLTLRDIEREGIGYKNGYATVEALFAPDPYNGFVPMLDVRGHHLYDDTYAANVGLIGRYVPACSCAIWGVNVYYDYRQGNLSNYHQLGVGAELLNLNFLCTCWDIRANGNIGARLHKQKCTYEFEGGFFAIFRKRELSFEGFNGEIGTYLVRSCNYSVYLAGGPYFVAGISKGHAWGGRVRLRPQFRDIFAIEISASHDHIFNTIVQGEIILSLPLYDMFRKNRQRCYCPSDRQIFQPVERFEIIPFEKTHGCWEKNF